ncbi:DUF2515 family protein [Paenibacillus arenosi]|nr:DUF2515 family protein [Paenibacillus arenosi]
MSKLKGIPWKETIKLAQQFMRTVYNAIRRFIQNTMARWLPQRPRTLEWNDAHVIRIEDNLKRYFLEQGKQKSADSLFHTIHRHHLSRDERELIQYIKRSVRNANRSNITRTAAYLRIYTSHPELHWALLAHMVSRNGGYNMTDLKGEWLPAFMNSEYRHWSYRMLERCNALIFHDAYCQLLLYASSRKSGKSLFHLLPFFGVSAFMTPVWDTFWIQPNSPLLTISLIINEQNVIEGRVIQNPTFQQHIIQRKDFLAHGLLQMNQIIFPTQTPHATSPARLVGLTLERFDNLEERIAFGKQLYTILFDIPDVLEGVQKFARAVPHTGSRADYWPHRFTLDKLALRRDRSITTAYSPRLVDVWQDEQHAPIEVGDWLHDEGAVHNLFLPTIPHGIDMNDAHHQLLNEMQSMARIAANNSRML